MSRPFASSQIDDERLLFLPEHNETISPTAILLTSYYILSMDR
jgi:hypothetical protein